MVVYNQGGLELQLLWLSTTTSTIKVTERSDHGGAQRPRGARYERPRGREVRATPGATVSNRERSDPGEPDATGRAGLGRHVVSDGIRQFFYKKNYFQTFKIFERHPTEHAVLSATTNGVQTRYVQEGEKSCNAMVVDNQQV
jgi:hypothetical protein